MEYIISKISIIRPVLALAIILYTCFSTAAAESRYNAWDKHGSVYSSQFEIFAGCQISIKIIVDVASNVTLHRNHEILNQIIKLFRQKSVITLTLEEFTFVGDQSDNPQLLPNRIKYLSFINLSKASCLVHLYIPYRGTFLYLVGVKS